jgi:putative addiction module killer protein
MEIREYLDADGYSGFAAWFDRMDAVAAAKVTVAITRLGSGNFSSVKGVGAGVLECRIDFGPGYRVYFGKEGDVLLILLAGETKKTTTVGHRDSAPTMERLQEPKEGEWIKMPLTKSFKETVQARAQREPAFRDALLAEGVEALLGGDLDTGKAVLRDYINATVGFEKLAAATGTPPKSLMRMFGPKGNPNARNLLSVIGQLQRTSGVNLSVHTQN